MAKQSKFSVGDSVVVKDGVKCPDWEEISIGGWQGRVTQVNEEGGVVIAIKWDSVTLRSVPDHYIEQSEREGFGWDEMYLRPGDVTAAQPRDTEQDITTASDEIESRHAWDSLWEECPSLKEVLGGVDGRDIWACYEAWEKHLRAVLTLPFEAEVCDGDGMGPIGRGDRVRVLDISGADDHYGVMVKAKRRWRARPFPLCDLDVCDKRSTNYQPVREYRVWFANH